MDLSLFEEKYKIIEDKMQHLSIGGEDIFNRLIATDNYLDKYLPYNMFTQLFEILHIALPK